MMRGRCFSLAGMRSKLVAAQYLIGSVDELVAAHSPERRQRDLIEVGDRPEFGRLPYFPEDVVAALSTAAPLVLVGTKSPVAFFGYREHPSALAEGVATLTLSTGEEDSYAALVALDEELSGLPVGASTATVSVGGQTAALSDEQGLDGWTIGSVAAETMPEDAIVSIEGGTVGHSFFAASQNGPRHSVLTNTGGAIGQGLPVAFGASLAAPRRRVVAIQSDGSAQYTVQALWSMAREGTDITVVLVSNQKYGILNTELQRLGHTSGDLANSLTSLTNPSLDWCATARGYGVPSSQVHSVGELRAALRRAHAVPGPTLVEAVVG
ncbi:hypothetical protein CJ178_07310 [Rhodococcus sp. ACPA4]|nr:hypothetical protein CJ178_07310 [Rhodococcus sp. ACPA4]